MYKNRQTYRYYSFLLINLFKMVFVVSNYIMICRRISNKHFIESMTDLAL